MRVAAYRYNQTTNSMGDTIYLHHISDLLVWIHWRHVNILTPIHDLFLLVTLEKVDPRIEVTRQGGKMLWGSEVFCADRNIAWCAVWYTKVASTVTNIRCSIVRHFQAGPQQCIYIYTLQVDTAPDRKLLLVTCIYSNHCVLFLKLRFE